MYNSKDVCSQVVNIIIFLCCFVWFLWRSFSSLSSKGDSFGIVYKWSHKSNGPVFEHDVLIARLLLVLACVEICREGWVKRGKN